jgi:transposase InsO family protein
MKLLQDLLASQSPDDCPRRGAGQKPQRVLERSVRNHVTDFSNWTAEQGWTLDRIADLLHLSPRTLRHWHYDAQRQLLVPRLIVPRGRPLLRSPVYERNAVIDMLDHFGPATGIPTLRESFPNMPRAELEDLLRRYRRVCRRRYQHAPRVLQWTTPGSVWAMDFSETPELIDGNYRYLFAVRDLASGQTLLWQPVDAPTAEQTVKMLTGLFTVHGTPLVLKSDNGSPFTADATRHLLAQFGVIPLFSPPYWPRYNGAIEAGIGSLKTRTEHQAANHGHPGYWTYDDVAAAQILANATSRPRRSRGLVAEELWQLRSPTRADERMRFQAAVERHRLDPDLVLTPEDPSADNTQEHRTQERQAIQRALVEHGYLLFSRRRIPLPFQKQKVTNIR